MIKFNQIFTCKMLVLKNSLPNLLPADIVLTRTFMPYQCAAGLPVLALRYAIAMSYHVETRISFYICEYW